MRNDYEKRPTLDLLKLAALRNESGGDLPADLKAALKGRGYNCPEAITLN